MPQLDVFNQDAFSLQSLTDTFINLPHKPMRLGELGLFAEKGIRTTSLNVESMSGQLTLIQSSERGGDSVDPVTKSARSLRTFQTYHLERDSKVYADEVQNVRSFGSETELQSVQDLVEERLATLRGMHEATLEYHRVNAMQGILLDADGSTLLNLFTEFGVVQQTKDFVFTTTTTDVRGKIIEAKRQAEDELGGHVITGWRGICSSGWFDSFAGHANVQEVHKFQSSLTLRQDIRDGFEFAGVQWEEYRGSVAKPNSVGGGSAAFIPANVAYLIPQTAESIFVTRFAPADFEETVNTLGLPLYARQLPDPSGANKYRRILTQSNPICLCLRPRAVIKLTKS